MGPAQEPDCFIVKVGDAVLGKDGVPSKGPIYRSVYAKDGLVSLPAGMQSTWDSFV